MGLGKPADYVLEIKKEGVMANQFDDAFDPAKNHQTDQIRHLMVGTGSILLAIAVLVGLWEYWLEAILLPPLSGTVLPDSWSHEVEILSELFVCSLLVALLIVGSSRLRNFLWTGVNGAIEGVSNPTLRVLHQQLQSTLDQKEEAENLLLMRNRHAHSLLRLARRTAITESQEDLLQAALEQVREHLDLNRVWFYMPTEIHNVYRLFMCKGDMNEVLFSEVPHLKMKGDRFLEELIASSKPVLVEDARTDPRTDKEIVAALGNRTILNVTIPLRDGSKGILGTGSFGDEGVRNLTDLQVAFFESMGQQVAGCLDRIILKREHSRATENVGRLSQVLAQSPLPLVITDLSGVISYVNPQFEESMGYSTDDIKGQSLRLEKSTGGSADVCEISFLDGTARQRLSRFKEIGGAPDKPLNFPWPEIILGRDQHKDWQNVISGGQWRGEAQNRRGDGEICWLSVIVSPIKNSTGEINDFVVILEDITERKAAETRMVETKEEAEKANMAKSDFLASMSHELRTPLNAVIGFAQMLQLDPKAPLSPRQSENVEHILEGGKLLLELVNEILDLAKIEADQITLDLKDINTNEVVSECVAMANSLGSSKSIEITNRLGDRPPVYLHTDGTRFKLIVLNLLSNAVKYNKDNGSVTVDNQITEDGFLRISVTDTGIGIPEEDHAKIFQVFHRLSASSLVAREGMGIGLTVTKLLVEKMAGRIGFESQENVGSLFWIEFPLASDEKIFIWSNKLLVGANPIDQDHQAILNLMNKVTHQDGSDAELAINLEKLINSIHRHFRREEVIMISVGYPDLTAHQESHRKFREWVDYLFSDWRETHDKNAHHRLGEFMRSWWIDHIVNADAKIGPYAVGKEQQIRNALKSLE
jgi:hemerythrin-like metal-binding protein